MVTTHFPTEVGGGQGFGLFVAVVLLCFGCTMWQAGSSPSRD